MNRISAVYEGCGRCLNSTSAPVNLSLVFFDMREKKGFSDEETKTLLSAENAGQKDGTLTCSFNHQTIATHGDT